MIYDDEHYFMGGALAEKLLGLGRRVSYVTPAAGVSAWTAMTDEQFFIQRRLLQLGLEVETHRVIAGVTGAVLLTACTYTGELDNLVLVTGRLPNDRLFRELDLPATRIGDCLVPSSIAEAVYAGHRFAREFDEAPATLVPRRERTRIEPPALDEVALP